jgi:TetR/AcrR family transcriptional regulator
MEVAQGVPFLGDVLLSGPLKTLLDDKAAVIARWSSEGRLAPVDPYHLIFMIWATTHFETAISNFLGGGNEEAHFEKARRTLEQVFLNGIRPAR